MLKPSLDLLFSAILSKYNSLIDNFSRNKSLFKHIISAVVLCISLMFSTASHAEKVRQFVALAFDGSKSLEMWQETLDYAKANNIKFTYFISGVYFLTNENAGYYKGPRRRAGRSDIGFGGTKEEVAARIAFLRRAFREGHEIASHANGHWNGANWSYAEWLDELERFQDIMINTHEINGISNSNPREWTHIIASIKGFRAPLLGWNNNMLRALRDMGYVYDTSRTASRDYWPQQEGEGIWNFPLASIPVGRGSVLSMDYNFLVLHKNSGADPQTSMQNAYDRYFEHNYGGMRAPISIGHHFSRWRGGAYWRAMQNFGAKYCGIQDVQCGTYSELVELMGRIRVVSQ